MDIEIASGKPTPVNPRVYGIICAEMLRNNLVATPEYLAALTDLKFKIFLYPGGSLSYYHHPTGTGGFNIRQEEYEQSAHGVNAPWSQYASGPDHFEQYIQFVKASGGEAVFVANVLYGNAAELDEFLTRLGAADVPIACVALGQEMHLGPGRALGLDGYMERINPLIAMLQAKYPTVPIVAPATPVARGAERASDSFHEWNKALAQLPGISGFTQYGWTEFGGQARLGAKESARDETPDEIWRKYSEFVKAFPAEQIPTYQADWGADKKMYLTQWGTHADRGTPVQGLHIANFYFFMAEYDATHNNYIAAAMSAVNLALKSTGATREVGTGDPEKITLLAPYLYTKPFRHLFSGDTSLLAASVQGAEGRAKGEVVKALAAAGPDGRKYLYLINSGPAIALGELTVDGKALPAGSRVEVESVWGNPDAGGQASRGGEAPAKSFTGERDLGALVLEPLSLTLAIIPNQDPPDDPPPPKAASNAAFAPVPDDPSLPRVLLLGDSISVGYTVPVRRALAGKANVHRPAANCGATWQGLEHLDEWLGDGRWDLIHFNWGLHDLQQSSLEQYESNLRALVSRLKKTGATLVWCSTTPVPDVGPRRMNNGNVEEFNATAAKIMKENGIAIDDLFSFALPRQKEIQIPGNVHFTSEGYMILAEQVTTSILEALK
ncbi:MAG: SGNH/GDSL hydrolase family protein [Candidatus Sumerlaeota bacterium]|nr:SGNH/GDSL hydrolase family protein [Candidatus Sumerlaeota bacterium]